MVEVWGKYMIIGYLDPLGLGFRVYGLGYCLGAQSPGSQVRAKTFTACSACVKLGI